ncbi:MAG TPA: bifunctional 2-C-methyl-D-erythritol 4-phosphate cytidylyltransferase/2-C-methyl-D-erythritol 2,4-cyclodiphosphate synthase [Bauldia sp.]|nr:bifunctional 2-C-methyl-D-erythritol 4-phosphate cytidylyltransferase/2-C-methyl-D-erythritol 2,4-cyclodiphosphate synthase [Bauldia sp.]
MKIAALIVAAGKGTRAGTGEIPKQYRTISGKPVLRHSLDTFLSHPAVDNVLVVVGRTDGSLYNAAAPQHSRLLPAIVGGDTRQASVRNGLSALARVRPDVVLIHDAARPLVSTALITRVIEGLTTGEAVVPAVPLADTLKRANDDGLVVETVARDGLHAAQTPQAFYFDAIRAAHEEAAASGMEFTDDAGLAEWASIPVTLVPGDAANTKLTTPEDFAEVAQRLATRAAFELGDVRVGVGYDVHAFGPGGGIMLGGVPIPHDKGLLGHSDADVALHALTDAVLGALGEGDIGVHFPPSDPKWRAASSDRFLAFAAERVRQRNGIIAHLDLAIVAEAPKIAPVREAMRNRIAAICDIGVDRVAVKATTSEGLGFIGRSEGIAAMATATIRLPFVF